MLKLYTGIYDIPQFTESIFSEYFEEDKSYEEILIDEDVLILDKEKYLVDDVKEYLEFYKYKPLNLKKMSIIFNFDSIDLKIQNKLLKIYEESEHLHIITVSNKKKVLPTILSRSNMNESENNLKTYDKYPIRYKEVLNIIITKIDIDNENIDKYLKVNDLLKDNLYHPTYLYLTTNFLNYDNQIVYELIQYNCKDIPLEYLLNLQERLFVNCDRNFQIEAFLLDYKSFK